MAKVRLTSTGAIPNPLKLKKNGDTSVTFESALKACTVKFAAGSPFGESEFAVGGSAWTNRVRVEIPPGRYSFSYSWEGDGRGKATRMADIDIS